MESVPYPMKENHTTFHKVRIKWHWVSASITTEHRTLSNKDTRGVAAFQREAQTQLNLWDRRLMHQGRSCISRVTTVRHHTEKLFYTSFLLIIFHNVTPAVIPGVGLRDGKDPTENTSYRKKVSLRVQQLQMKCCSLNNNPDDDDKDKHNIVIRLGNKVVWSSWRVFPLCWVRMIR